MRDEVIQSGGQVSAEKLATLQRLARLAELCNAAPPLPRKRWPVAAALGLTLVLVSILLFVRVPVTEIELDLALSEVSFVLSSPQKFSDAMALSALGVSGLREIQLPIDARRDATRRGGPDGPEVAVLLSVGSSGKRHGTITLAPLILPAGTQVWVRRTGVSHLMSISGLHVTMVASLFAALVHWLWRRSSALMLALPARKASALACFVAAFGYHSRRR